MKSYLHYIKIHKLDVKTKKNIFIYNEGNLLVVRSIH